VGEIIADFVKKLLKVGVYYEREIIKT